jgi:UDP-glucose 4-epimerase
MNNLINILKTKGVKSLIDECKSNENYKHICLDNTMAFTKMIFKEKGYNVSEDLDYPHLFKHFYLIDPELNNNEKNLNESNIRGHLDLSKFLIENGARFSCTTKVELGERPKVTPCQPVPGKFILVTGGAGYIGSHTVFELLEQGHDVIIVDDFSNSCPESLVRVEKLAGKKLLTYNINILDKSKLNKVFDDHPIWAVIHFAGFKSVNESIQKPLMYYSNNVYGTVVLLECMLEHNCNNIVFSSSATVYGEPQVLPIPESHPLSPINPYGRSKLMAEQVIQDVCVANKNFNAALLRYFNPIGAHESGEIGEDPRGIPNNLLPYVAQTLVGRREFLSVFGADYPTMDKTGVRDFIHVVDLALGHCSALEYLRTETPHDIIFNMGTGTGYSVLQIVNSMECAADRKIKVKIAPRRPGDAAEVVANPSKAQQYLGWMATRGIDKMCTDAWKWQSKNPKGFNKE